MQGTDIFRVFLVVKILVLLFTLPASGIYAADNPKSAAIAWVDANADFVGDLHYGSWPGRLKIGEKGAKNTGTFFLEFSTQTVARVATQKVPGAPPESGVS